MRRPSLVHRFAALVAQFPPPLRNYGRLVERELEKRGFERVRRGPDLRVGVLLNVRREEVIIHETHGG